MLNFKLNHLSVKQYFTKFGGTFSRHNRIEETLTLLASVAREPHVTG